MRSQRIGQGFESPYLHQMQIIRTLINNRVRIFLYFLGIRTPNTRERVILYIYDFRLCRKAIATVFGCPKRLRIPLSPPRRIATFCQPPANMQVAMTLRSVAPFPTNLLLCKIFAGALKTGGVLCAYFTRTSPPDENNTNFDE